MSYKTIAEIRNSLTFCLNFYNIDIFWHVRMLSESAKKTKACEVKRQRGKATPPSPTVQGVLSKRGSHSRSYSTWRTPGPSNSGTI